MSTAIRNRRWTRAEYDRMVDAAVFGPDDRIELLDGEVLEVSPQGDRHAGFTVLVAERLREAFRAGCHVRCQVPFALDDASEPEPDAAVVRGLPRDYLDAKPSRALLLVEVSDSSLEYDRGRKLRAYARNAVPEYWIVNLVDMRLEVFRDPRGEIYATRVVLVPGDTVAPLHAEAAHIPVADLLP